MGGWKKNKGETFYNRGSGLSWTHRQCGFYQRHAMLVPICQLRLHVNFFRQGKYRETWRCLFTHKWSPKCGPLGTQDRFPAGASLPQLLTIRYLQTQQDARKWPTFNPLNPSSRQIHSSSRPHGFWCCLPGPKEKVAPHFQTTVCYNTATNMPNRLFCCRFYLSLGDFKHQGYWVWADFSVIITSQINS